MNCKNAILRDTVRSLLGAALVTLVLPSTTAWAEASGTGDFGGTITDIISNQLFSIPGLISALAYIGGIMLMVSGVLKMKDYTDNPNQQKLHVGIGRMFAGSALISLPTFIGWVYNTLMLSSSITIPVAKKFGSGIASMLSGS